MKLKKLLVMTLSVLTILSTFNVNTVMASAEEVATSDSSNVQEDKPEVWDRTTNFPDENGELRFWMDDLEDRLDTLTLEYIYDDGNVPIKGAKVAVYQISTLTVKDGDAKYTLIDSLKEKYSDVNFAGMSSTEIDELAEKLSKEDLTPVAEVETNEKGVAKFENLEHGFYLIKEQAKTGPAADYEYFKPFLLNLPFPSTTENMYEGHWIYDVEALPKTRIPTKKKLIIIPPQTGDNTNYTYLYFFGGLLAVSVVETVAIIILLKKRNKKNNS